jgi:hypothetical protein
MALFSSEELTREIDDDKTFELEVIKNGQEATLFLTISVTNKIREVAKQAKIKYPGFKAVTRKNKQEFISVDEFYEYNRMVLKRAYKEASGDVIDEYSLTIVLALLKKFPVVAKLLAILMQDFFDGESKKEEE